LFESPSYHNRQKNLPEKFSEEKVKEIFRFGKKKCRHKSTKEKIRNDFVLYVPFCG